MLDLLFPAKRAYINASNATAVLALVAAGTTVVGQGSQPIRAMLPSGQGTTYSMFGTTLLGSEALPLGGATLVSGTRYKIATSLAVPNSGGPNVAVFLYTNGVGYDGSSTPTALARNTTNSSTTGANAWAMPGDGFFYFDLNRAVTANDVVEMPQRYNVQVDHSNMRILGGTFAHANGYNFYVGITRSLTSCEIGFALIKWGNSDGINVKGNTGGVCLDVRIHDCILYELAYDGAGGGDGVSVENCTPGHSGSILRCIFTRCAKSGLANNDSNLFDYHDLLFDGCSIALGGAGPQPGIHRMSRIRMINGWTSPATGVHGFYILPGTSASTVIIIDGLSAYPGTNATTGLRAFRAQGGAVTIINSVIDSHGAAVPFNDGFMNSSTTGTYSDSNCAAGGMAASNFTGSGFNVNDIDLAATPFVNAAAGDLTGNALLIGKGVGGVTIGYESTAA